MKYSESSDYMDYAQSKARGDIASAKLSLAVCLSIPEFKNQPSQYADLLQRMGELCFLDGERERALKYYEESETADPNSLLVKYYRAEFLGSRVGDKKTAVAMCDRIVSIARDHPFAESEDDFSSEAYIAKAERLKASLLS
jgi:tetratricopeptide (TPR) repeat protein